MLSIQPVADPVSGRLRGTVVFRDISVQVYQGLSHYRIADFLEANAASSVSIAIWALANLAGKPGSHSAL